MVLLYLKVFLVIICAFAGKLYSQNYIQSNAYALPANNLLRQFKDLSIEKDDSIFCENIIGSKFSFSTNFHIILNKGHSNIDNYGDIFITDGFARYSSFKFEYQNKWMFVEIQPYQILYSGYKRVSLSQDNYTYLNNHYGKTNNIDTKVGFHQSQIVLHISGIGFGYGVINHWWGPGFHSALALSSNAPSQGTFSFGTFRDKYIGRFSLGAKAIVIPYASNNGSQLYFSGLKTKLTYHSNPVISIGLYRTFLSGNINKLHSYTNTDIDWSLKDAIKLIYQPFFVKDKTQLNYVRPGTGNDLWDQTLTGFFKMAFPEENLELYISLATDDSRKNIVDLKAHWDHAIGYLLGAKKFYSLNKKKLFTGVEFLTTRGSNSLNPLFYRGPQNAANFYASGDFDYFSYKGRRMGAHSGSSSDDLIFMVGLSDDISTTLMSFNKERHGIKSMTHPELKTEYVLTYHRKMSQHHTAFITLEYETIKNFGFIQNNVSVSKLIWLGYSFSIN